jgi:hypothetical protein
VRARLRKRLQRSPLKGSVVVGGIEAGYNHARRRWVVHAHLVVFGAGSNSVASLVAGWPGDEAKKPTVVQRLRDHIPQLSYMSKFVTYHRPLANRAAYPLNGRECREWVKWVSQYSFADFLFLLGARCQGDQITCRSCE